MSHVHSSQLRSHQWPASFGLGYPSHPSAAKALAPARGALVGSALGLGFWALVALAVWAVL